MKTTVIAETLAPVIGSPLAASASEIEQDSPRAEKELVMTTKQPTWLRSTIWVVCLGILATSVAGCVVAPIHHHY
jgi:hypothetical protein